jgi:hypothetical protein
MLGRDLQDGYMMHKKTKILNQSQWSQAKDKYTKNYLDGAIIWNLLETYSHTFTMVLTKFTFTKIGESFEISFSNRWL